MELASCTSIHPASQSSDIKTDTQLISSCVSIGSLMQGKWPDPSTRVVESRWIEEGSRVKNPFGMPVEVPAHCEVVGAMQARTGIDGQPYAIRFHLRLPQKWNQHFFFQGGGGTNGNLGDAMGLTSAKGTSLEQEALKMPTTFVARRPDLLTNMLRGHNYK